MSRLDRHVAMVQNKLALGRFVGALAWATVFWAAAVWVSALNSVDLPTFGRPTIPHLKLMSTFPWYAAAA